MLKLKKALVASVCLAIAGVVLVNCSGSGVVTPAESLPIGASAMQTNVRGPLAGWRVSMQHGGLPSSGCFKADYPATHWTRVTCATPPNLLYPLPRHARRAHAKVGNGNDYTVQTGSRKISEAVGSFPAVTGVANVQSEPNPKFGTGCNCGPNAYTLQLNSSFFSTAACKGKPNCVGWEQFVYENPPGGTDGELFIQDWLLPADLTGSIRCPKHAHWESVDGACVQNSKYAVAIPNLNITALSGLVETGAAAASGDSAYLSVGGTLYGLKNIQRDGITDLSTHWTGAEFNVVGNAGGSVAVFNARSTITVNLQADDGVTTAPTCEGKSGTTGESANLSFVAAPPGPAAQKYPSIEFKESNASGGGAARCDAIAAI